MVHRTGLIRVGLRLALVALALILLEGIQTTVFAQSTEGTEFDFDGPCITTLAAQLPIEFEYMGTIPTGFDGINRATCTFTKEVKTVTVTLSGPADHTEIFTLGEPSTEVPFPLPEDTLSITTLEIVPPGEYQREMTVTSVDDETLVISDQPGVLKTVTIVEPSTAPSRGVVTGTVTYRERIALSPQAEVEVKLLDVSRADAPAITIGEQIIENPGQVPIDFEIEYNPGDIDDRFTYAVRASILENGELAFTTETRYSVITRDSPTHVDMVLVKVGDAPSESTTPPEVGGMALPNWLLVMMAGIGVLLVPLGMRVLISARPNR